MSNTCIAVCGRGVSLRRYYDRTWKRVYVVNNISEEFRAVVAPVVSEELIHVAGRKGATAIDFPVDRTVINAMTEKHHDNYKRFNGVTVEYRPECMFDRGYPPVGWKKILRGKFDAARKSNNGNCWPTTGLFAIDLACVENHPCSIHLFGFDFYRKPYFIKPNRPYQTQDNPKIICMYVYLRKLVDEFKDVNFYCYSKLGMKGDNWIEK